MKVGLGEGVGEGGGGIDAGGEALGGVDWLAGVAEASAMISKRRI